MGQYFLIFNEAKNEYIHPHDFGDGAKLLELGTSSHGAMTALTLLLRQSSASEGVGGDYHGPPGEVVGRWAGDPIKIVGDYDESGDYNRAQDAGSNISLTVLVAMAEDPFLRQELKVRLAWRIPTLPPQEAKVLAKALGL